MSEKFNLKWNDFHTNFSKSLGLSRKEDYLHDVTLVGDDNVQISAHKFALAASSEYFQSVFKNNRNSNLQLVLCLEGLSSGELTNVLDYIYNGEVQLYQEDLDRFLDIAQRLKLKGMMGNTTNFEEKGRTEREEELQLEEAKSNVMPTSSEFKQPSNESCGQITSYNSDPLSISSTEQNEIDAKINEFVECLERGKYNCLKCGKISATKQQIVRHVETHFDGLSYPCQLCGKTFRSRNLFQTHKYTYHKK